MNNNTLITRRSLVEEIKYFLRLALPITVSFMTEPIMHFFDRLFLSHYREGQGEVYLSASLAGGIIAFLIVSLFSTIAGYSTTLVAQHFGANRHKDCGNITLQAIIFSIYIAPFSLIFLLFIDKFYALFGHEPLQQLLEVQYSRILVLGGVLTCLRSSISGFFTGIGKTHIVMISSIIAMLINIPLNYILIFGIGFIPEMGIKGAALATIISSGIAFFILLINYLNRNIHKEFHTRIPFRFHLPFMKKLLKYGTPSGIETFISIGAFSIFITSMSGYGSHVGAAVTIAINWDATFFIPMFGMSFATTSIVGQYMGRKDTIGAIRALKITLGTMGTFAIIVAYMLFVHPNLLINMFLDKITQREEVYLLTKTMLQLVCVYLGMDATSLAIGSLLRGAGDTQAVMYIFVFIDILFIIAVSLLIVPQRVTPIGGWWIFIGFPVALCVGVLIRYVQGKWKHISLVDEIKTK